MLSFVSTISFYLSISLFLFHIVFSSCSLQEGKLTPEAAIAYKQMLSQTNESMRTHSISKGDRLFNFHVIRWTKGRNVERLILQVSIMEIKSINLLAIMVIYFVNILVLPGRTL